MQTQAQFAPANPVSPQPVRPLRPVLKKNMAEIERLCRLHHVKHLWVFGSVTNEKFNRKSDIDFLVEMEALDHEAYADSYFELLFGLQDLFHRDIDLITVKQLSNPYFIESVMEQRQHIYG